MLTAVDETLSSLRDLRVNTAFDKLLADNEEIVVELDLEALIDSSSSASTTKTIHRRCGPTCCDNSQRLLPSIVFRACRHRSSTAGEPFPRQREYPQVPGLGESAVAPGMRRCSGQSQPVGIRRDRLG